jgi:hypothetical protein
MNINSDPFRSISTVFLIMVTLLMGLVYGWGRQERIIAKQQHEAAMTALTNERDLALSKLAAAERSITALTEEAAGKEEAERLAEGLLAQIQDMEREIGELRQQIAELNGALTAPNGSMRFPGRRALGRIASADARSCNPLSAAALN